MTRHPGSWYGPLALLAIMLLAVSGCVPEDLTGYDFKQHQPPSTITEDPGNVLIDSRSAGATDVDLYIDKGAHTGYNRISIGLSDAATEDVLTTADVSILPSFEFDGFARAVPFTNPSSTSANEDGYFEASAFLLPPEAGAGSFTLDVTFDAGSGREGSVTFDLPVEESVWMQRVDGPDGLYYVSWVHPKLPEVGENDFEVALHSEPDYAPMSSETIDLYPYMDMGGGDGHSTPYEAPVHKSGPFYDGMVNFIMSGGWEMTVYVRHPDGQTDTVLFDAFTVY